MGYSVKGDILLEFGEAQEIALALAFPSFKNSNDSIFNNHVMSPRSKTVEYYQQALEAAYFTYIYDCTGTASVASRFRAAAYTGRLFETPQNEKLEMHEKTRAYGADFDSKWYPTTTETILEFLASLGFGIIAEFEGEDGEKWLSYNPLGVMTGMETYSVLPILSYELDELVEAKKQVTRIESLLANDEEELDPTIFMKRAREILSQTIPADVA